MIKIQIKENEENKGFLPRVKNIINTKIKIQDMCKMKREKLQQLLNRDKRVKSSFEPIYSIITEKGSVCVSQGQLERFAEQQKEKRSELREEN